MGDILIIVILIVINGLFSMSEVALISARKSRLTADAKSGDKGAETALALAEDPDKFLSTIQIGITLIGILTGLFSGAALSDILAEWLHSLGVSVHAAKPVAQIVIVVIVTYLSIVVGELLPKRIGLNASDRVARIMSRPMRWLSIVAMPAVWILSKSTAFLVKMFHLEHSSNTVTEDEIKSVIREGKDAGEVKDMEKDIMFRALVMGDEKVNSIMTHRIDLVVLDLSMSVQDIKHVIKENLHSSYPVYDEVREDIVGVVALKDLIFEICNDAFSLRDVVKPGVFMPETMFVYDALDMLKQSGAHCGMVCDEFGAVQGLVTLCDILGGLVGSVEVGTDEPFIVERVQDKGWLVDGQCPIYDFMSYFNLADNYVPSDYTTLAGLILENLKRIPKVGDVFEFHDLLLEIGDMDGARIDRVIVTKQPT